MLVEEDEEEVEEPEEPSPMSTEPLETKMLTNYENILEVDEQELEAEPHDDQGSEEQQAAESEELQPHVDQSGPELARTVITTLVELSEENEVDDDQPENQGDGNIETQYETMQT